MGLELWSPEGGLRGWKVPPVNLESLSAPLWAELEPFIGLRPHRPSVSRALSPGPTPFSRSTGSLLLEVISPTGKQGPTEAQDSLRVTERCEDQRLLPSTLGRAGDAAGPLGLAGGNVLEAGMAQPVSAQTRALDAPQLEREA